jgi:hypothetical protein
MNLHQNYSLKDLQTLLTKYKIGEVRLPILALRQAKNLIGAEVGVRIGRHAEVILDLLDIKKLYLIDPYTPYIEQSREWKLHETHEWLKDAKKKLLHYEDKISWLIKTSAEAVNDIGDNELDFVYIDGNHDYEFVKSDMMLYSDKVKSGGIISGHDYGAEGVNRAIEELFGTGIYIDEVTTSWWTYKV